MHLPIVFYICSKNINITHITIIIMKKLLILIALPVLALILTLSSCSKDDDDPIVVIPTFTEKYNNTYWTFEEDGDEGDATYITFSTDFVIKIMEGGTALDTTSCATLEEGTFPYTDYNSEIPYEQTTSILTNLEDNYSFKQMSTSGQSVTISSTITDNTMYLTFTDCDGSETDTLTKTDNPNLQCTETINNFWFGCDDPVPTFTEKYNNTYWTFIEDGEVTIFTFSEDFVLKVITEGDGKLPGDTTFCSITDEGTFSYIDANSGASYNQTTTISENMGDYFSFTQSSTNGEEFFLDFSVIESTIFVTSMDCDGMETIIATKIDDPGLECTLSQNNLWLGCDDE